MDADSIERRWQSIMSLFGDRKEKEFWCRERRCRARSIPASALNRTATRPTPSTPQQPERNPNRDHCARYQWQDLAYPAIWELLAPHNTGGGKGGGVFEWLVRREEGARCGRRE